METKEQLETLVIRLSLVIREAKTHLEKYYPGKQSLGGWGFLEEAKEWKSTLEELECGLKRASGILERNQI